MRVVNSTPQIEKRALFRMSRAVSMLVLARLVLAGLVLAGLLLGCVRSTRGACTGRHRGKLKKLIV